MSNLAKNAATTAQIGDTAGEAKKGAQEAASLTLGASSSSGASPPTALKPFYSLWYDLPAEILQPIQDEVVALASKFNTPIYTAHLTLLGGLPITTEEEMIAKCEKLASLLTPVNVTFTKFSEMNNGKRPRSRWPFGARLDGPVSDALLRAAATAGTIFGIPNSGFFVHTTVIYLADDALPKEGVVKKLAEKGLQSAMNKTFEVKSFALVRTPIIDRFRTSKQLYDCVSKWEVVKTFEIKAQD